MVVGGGFEPPNSKRADLQSAAFDRSATPPSSILEQAKGIQPYMTRPNSIMPIV